METTSEKNMAGWARRFICWLFSWRTIRRALITLAGFVTLVALFYTEENWRGKRAWEQRKRDLEAQGFVLDWEKFIPPPVPDSQNIFKAPKMQEWFVGRGATELSKRLTNSATASVTSINVITNEKAAAEYIAWSREFEPEFNLIRETVKRPYARMDGDYDEPAFIPIPNFVTLRIVAQTLAQRTHCHLLLEQPETALQDLMLLHDLSRFLEAKPTGKPMTLVAAMINVAITGLYASTVTDGLRLHAWREPQLAVIQQQLRDMNLIPIVAGAFRDEPVAVSYTFENTPPGRIADQYIGLSGGKTNFWARLKTPTYVFMTLAPRGWVYQNLVVYWELGGKTFKGFERNDQLIVPHLAKQAESEILAALSKSTRYNYLARIGMPSFAKAALTLARYQTLANQTLIACTLERFHLAHGEYPEALDALVPQFLDQIPHDIIGGDQVHYRRTNNGEFVLYSIGWNETDDGGAVAFTKGKTPAIDFNQGDWVWPMQAQ